MEKKVIAVRLELELSNEMWVAYCRLAQFGEGAGASTKVIDSFFFRTIVESFCSSLVRLVNYSTHVHSWLRSIRRPSHRRLRHLQLQRLYRKHSNNLLLWTLIDKIVFNGVRDAERIEFFKESELRAVTYRRHRHHHLEAF